MMPHDSIAAAGRVTDKKPSIAIIGGGIGGSASLIAIQAEQMLYTKKKLQELTAQHTGIFFAANRVAEDGARPGHRSPCSTCTGGTDTTVALERRSRRRQPAPGTG